MKDHEAKPENQKGSFNFFKNIFGRPDSANFNSVNPLEQYFKYTKNKDGYSNDENIGRQEDLIHERRTYSKILKRIEDIIKCYENNKLLYRDEHFKIFWKPDQESENCHDCCQKFTYLRRRHHCRICGQIFCYSCCEQIIPGKFLKSIDDLKVCTFCCKIILTHLHSNLVGDEMLQELSVLRHQLLPPDPLPLDFTAKDGSKDRKVSYFGVVEDNASSKTKNANDHERDLLLSNSHQQQFLWYLMRSGPNPLPLSTHRWMLEVYPNTFDGRDFIKWLKARDKASTSESAVAIGQALLEAGFIYSVANTTDQFTEDYGIFGIRYAENSDENSLSRSLNQSQEPSWLKGIPSLSEKSKSSTPSPIKEVSFDSVNAMSNSSYSLDLNVEDNVVSISRSSKEMPINTEEKSTLQTSVTVDLNYALVTSASQQFASYSSTTDKGLEALNDFEPNEAEANAAEWQKKSDLPSRNRYPSGSHPSEDHDSKIFKNVKKRLISTWKTHEKVLFNQLMEFNGLSESWTDVILNIAYKVTETVSPDIRHEFDKMDLQEYVHFKKLPGGQTKDCQIINGTVCSKNVVRTDMRMTIADPQILLIQPAIAFVSESSNANEVFKQEAEYLRNVLPKLLSSKPSIIICGSRVMFKAIQQFMEANVTVIMNMKDSVLGRVARCTTAQIIKNIESELSMIPQRSNGEESALGMCHSFYLRSYEIPNKTKSKTLMFFDGCATHLGCTVILRGGSNSVLKRVKRMIQFMIFTLRNWKLEQSFLMDELAYIPHCYEQKAKMIEANQLNDRVKTQKQMEEEKCENEISFKKVMDKIVLSVSPFIHYPLPFLESDIGKNCSTRYLYTNIKYHSYAFSNDAKPLYVDDDTEIIPKPISNVEYKQPHKFILNPIVEDIKGSLVKGAITDFRARGCMIQTICPCDKAKYIQNDSSRTNYSKTKSKKTFKNKIVMKGGFYDSLHPYNHQQMSIYHFVFAQTAKDINMCIQSQLMKINFYGPDDLPLGYYLENHCFNASKYCGYCKKENIYSSTSRNAVIHVKKFVHNEGAVELIAKKISKAIVTSRSSSIIYMWTTCQVCKTNSAVIPMSLNTWMFSFGKFMELLFYENNMTRRDGKNCSHSLHQEHIHYFGRKDIVVAIKYSHLSVKNLFIPPLEIQYVVTSPFKEVLVDEIKSLSICGHNILTQIKGQLNKLLDQASDSFSSLIHSNLADIADHENNLKREVSNMQLRLTSKQYSDFLEDPVNNQDLSPSMHDIADQLIFIKRMVVRFIQDWNEKVNELLQRKKEDKLNLSITEDTSETKKETISTISEIMKDKSSDEDTKEMDIEEKRLKMIRSCSSPENIQDLLKNDLQDNKDESYKTSFTSSSTSNFRTTCSSDSSSTSSNSRSKFYYSSETVLSDFIRPGPKQFVSTKNIHESSSERRYGQSLKSIFSGSSNNPDIEMIKSPFPVTEHYTLFPEASVPVIIYDEEPSSIIAKALASQAYQKGLKILKERNNQSEESSFDKSNSKQTNNSILFIKNSQEGSNITIDKEHIALEWKDSTSNYYCKIFFANEFLNLRETMFPSGEEIFIRSLSRCANWEAKGGKSGSLFCKTKDDRFVLKEVSTPEMQTMDTFAPALINFLINGKREKKPTVLTRIIGIFSIAFKYTNGDKQLKSNLLVMENLFYRRNIVQKYDLKGVLRNREVTLNKNEDSEVVLLDRNLLKMACSSHFYLRRNCKTVLLKSIESDTEFLMKHFIMDYSLVVGVDEELNEMVVGIVDYLRPFTLDKRLEFMVKQMVTIPSGKDEKPTIVSPEVYRTRFCEAMEKYFAFTPDKWVGLDSSSTIPEDFN